MTFFRRFGDSAAFAEASAEASVSVVHYQKLNNDTNCLSSNSTHILLLFCLLEVVRSYYYVLQQLNKKLDRPLRSISHFCSSCKRRKNNDFQGTLLCHFFAMSPCKIFVGLCLNPGVDLDYSLSKIKLSHLLRCDLIQFLGRNGSVVIETQSCMLPPGFFQLSENTLIPFRCCQSHVVFGK